MKVEPIHQIDTLEFLSTWKLSVRATNVLSQMGLKTTAQFTSLDKQTLLGWRNCGKKTALEILEAIERFKLTENAAPKRLDAQALFAALERIPISDLRLSVRAAGALERLNISNIGQLTKVSDGEFLALSNFGKRSLREIRTKLAEVCSRGVVVWPTEERADHQLSRAITRAARKLQRLKISAGLFIDDRQFGHLIRELGLDAKTAREAAGCLILRKVDPLDPEPLLRRLNDLMKTLRSAASTSLESELLNLTDGLGSKRDRGIIVSQLGWDGTSPKTLEAVGQCHKMTRERVRQICARIERIRSSRPFAPMLDRALKITTRAAPALAEEVEKLLIERRLTRTKFTVESIAGAARDLGREPCFAIESRHGHRVVVPFDNSDFFERIDQRARSAVRHWGVATVEDIAAATEAPVALTQKFLSLLPGLKWLDESSGWFWIINTTQNGLLTQIRKILAASPCVDVGELRAGVGRHHRRKGFAPPRRVLLELCRQLPWCRVEGERIAATTQLDLHEVLSDSEQIILGVLKAHGPVIQRARLEKLCEDAGMNHHSFWVSLSYCPLICRHANSVYGLRGAEVPVGLVESLVPKRTGKSKLMIDYSWTDDRKVQILYRISDGMLSNGIVSVPSAMKDFLQGQFALVTGDNSKAGTLVVKDNSGWGLGPFFRRRGGESGDYLSIVYDLSKRVATVQIGDASLTDQFGNPDESSTAETAECSENNELGPAATESSQTSPPRPRL